MQKRTLCIWLPDWPLERLAAARPELDGRPVILYEQSSRGGLRSVAYAACLNAASGPKGSNLHEGGLNEARRASPQTGNRPLRAAQIGIRPGMPLAETIALYEHALQRGAALAGLHVEACDPTADRLALQDLAQWCQRFSPLVGLEDAPRPQCLLLDVSGLEAMFGGEPRLAALVDRQLAERGLTARTAIADTPAAAWAVSHYAASHCAEFPCVDSSGAATHPSRIVPAGATLAAVSPLPLHALRLAPGTIEMLNELGIRRIGQLVALPRAALLARFGPEPLQRIDQLLATAAEVLVMQKPDEPLVAERLFEYPTERRDAIELTLRQLLDGLTAPLAGERKGILRMACRLARPGTSPVQFEVSLYRPSGCARHLLELIALRLEALQFRASRRSPVEAVQLSVTATATLSVEQQELFQDDVSRTAPRQLAGLVDRLANRLGREAVTRPCLLADAQPEYACQYLPLDVAVPRTKRTKEPRRAPASMCGERPLRLLATPQPIEATSIAPAGPPLGFRFQGQEQRIVKTWGPERIETGWWRTSAGGTGSTGGASGTRNRAGGPRGSYARRDYYRVETGSGSRFWLFRRLHDGRWFLHGEFE